MIRLLPDDLASFAVTRAQSDFVNVHGGTAFLVVKLDDPSGELEAGLSALHGLQVMRVQSNLNVLGFHTLVADVVTLAPQLESLDAGVDELRRRLASGAHYAISLDKRVQDGTYADRISLGRARNKDVVLRHLSVSKFHAWFERDESGTFYVADAGSKNGTRVNQDECAARELKAVKLGDVIRFGSVESMLCAPDTLWKALQSK